MGLAGFSGFRFALIALFATAGNPAKRIVDERLICEDARAGGILKIL